MTHIDYFDHFDQYRIMPRKVSATEAKVRFGEILGDVSVGKNQVVIERQKKPIAAVIPYDQLQEYERLKAKAERLSRHEIIEQINRWRDSLPPPDPDAPSAVEIIRELRQRDRF